MESFAPEGFVFIPQGQFIYGPETCFERHIEGLELKPRQTLDIPGFWLAKFPVTYRDWQEFIQKTGYAWGGKWHTIVKRFPKKYLRAFAATTEYPPSLSDLPIVDVSLRDAECYTAWYGERYDLPCVLPTEQQWEKAARGMDGRPYPWGNQVPRPDIQWQKKFPVGIETYLYSLLFYPRRQWARAGLYWRNGFPLPVGSIQENVSVYGCYDMSGNIWEWTCSLYHSALPDYHVVKGGSWGYSIHHTQLFVRSACSLSTPSRGYRAPGTGFRLALNCDEHGHRP